MALLILAAPHDFDGPVPLGAHCEASAERHVAPSILNDSTCRPDKSTSRSGRTKSAGAAAWAHTPPSRVCALPAWRLQRVEIYIDGHMAEPVTLADLASAAGLSRMHFAAQFRLATGLRPHEHLLIRRVEHAKAALRQQDTPIVEVALSAGFQAQSHFSTVFKRLTGSSPAAWRRMAQTSRL